jgi:hypothetical protein
MKGFVAWLINGTDRRDDEWIEIESADKKTAEKIAGEALMFRYRNFSLRGIYTIAEFEKFYGKGLLNKAFIRKYKNK